MSDEKSKELRTNITSTGKLELSILSASMPQPKDGEVLIRVEATPINPSDLGLLLGPADVSTMTIAGSGDDAVVSMDVPRSYDACNGSKKLTSRYLPEMKVQVL